MIYAPNSNTLSSAGPYGSAPRSRPARRMGRRRALMLGLAAGTGSGTRIVSPRPAAAAPVRSAPAVSASRLAMQVNVPTSAIPVSGVPPASPQTAAAPAPATVQALLSAIGQAGLYASWCNCSGKYCSSDQASGCPTDQYAGCSYWANSVAQRQLCWPVPSAWTAGASSSAKIAAGATQVATVVPVVGPAIAAVGSIITGILGSHGAAQNAQASALAQAIPAVNQALAQIDAALSSGSMTAAQAGQEYSSLAAQFHSAVTQGTSYKSGDALWICDIALQLVVAARKQDLTGLPAGGAFGTLLENPLLWLAGGALALWLLL